MELKGQKRKYCYYRRQQFLEYRQCKEEWTNCLIIINGTKQTEDNIIKIPLDEEILSQVTLEPEAAIKKYGSEGKNGAMEITTGKPNTISKINESKVWINNQLSEIQMKIK
jgi:hypothetical protein